MKKFAHVENGVVTNVIVAADDFSGAGYVESPAGNPAFIGGDYQGGYFYPPQPYPSWTRNAGTWVPPVAEPHIEGKMFSWDEANRVWVEVHP